MAASVAIVILNWNGREFLRKFLPTVISCSKGAEVIVADNGSSDGSLEMLETQFPDIRRIVLDRNYGFAQGYNQALREVDAPLYMLLNSDVEVSPAWLEPLEEYMAKNPDMAAVMPKVLSYHDRDRFEHAGAAGGYLDMWGFPFCRGRIIDTLEQDHGQYDTPERVFWATGAAMLIRKEAFDRAGGFDGDFFAHMEEIDLAWRLQSLGYTIGVEPASKVWHVGGGTLPYSSPRKLFLNFRNSLFMLYKNLPTALLFPILFSRMCIDGAIGCGYLLRGEGGSFMAVIRAHFAFYGVLRALQRKRRMQRHSFPKAMYKGSILARVVVDKVLGRISIASTPKNGD